MENYTNLKGLKCLYDGHLDYLLPSDRKDENDVDRCTNSAERSDTNYAVRIDYPCGTIRQKGEQE